MNQTLPKVGKTISYLLASFCHDFHSLMVVFTFSYLRDLKSIVTKQWKTFIIYEVILIRYLYRYVSQVIQNVISDHISQISYFIFL